MDPLGLTGLVLVRFANLYWLVTVSGFQGSSCSRFRQLPAGLSAACRLCCVRRQGDTLLIRTHAVNRLSELFFGVFRAEFLRLIREAKAPPVSVRKAPTRQLVNRITAATWWPYVGLSERLSVFNTRSGLLCGSGGAVSYCTRLLLSAQGVIPYLLVPTLSEGQSTRQEAPSCACSPGVPTINQSVAIGRTNLRFPTWITWDSTRARAK
jgi:hypothetical protein